MIRWRDAVRTLAKFHRVDPKTVGLENFGRSVGFYGRQLETFRRVSEAQAQAADVETKEVVGKLPHFDEMVAFFSDSKRQPSDLSGLVHGDYKIDNLVFAKDEPRVIGILEYANPAPTCSSITDIAAQLGNVNHWPSPL